MIDLGDVNRLSITVTDDSTPPALVDSTVALNITLPDQTVVGPFTPVHDSTGKYHYDYTTVQAGRHAARWTGTSVAFAHTDVFDVQPAADISIISLTDAKKQVGFKATDNDDELRGYLLSASENIESAPGSACGICAPRTFTDRLTGDDAFWLTKTPVLSLTSFTPVRSWASPAVATSDVIVNKTTGEVTRVDATTFVGDYDITYVAGRAVIPPSIQTACRVVVQYLWATRRGPVTVQGGGMDTVVLPGWGYAIPNRAAQLLAPFMTGPVFA
jgi:hypothetical protein